MRVIHWRRKWFERAAFNSDVFVMASSAEQACETIARFHREDGTKAPPGWYATASWLDPGWRRFPTLLSAVRYALGRRPLHCSDATDYEDRTALDGFPTAHREIGQ